MLPQDNIILLSYINTKLRDAYSDLDALCEDLDESRESIEKRLESIGYRYDKELNKFV